MHAPSDDLNPAPLAGFDYQPRTRLVFGEGVSDRAGALARELGGRRALLVTDPGIVRAGHAARVRQSLEAAGLEVVPYDQVRENPTTRDVDACVSAAREAQVDLLVGLGGGSSLDTAKGCNFLLTNGGRMEDYRGVGRATRPMLPLLAIPTTAGTGSECQCAALIADDVTHQKMACLDPKAAARLALLDPRLTLSQPASVTAHTGIDALTHATETAVTRGRTPLSLAFAHGAFKLLVTALPRVLAMPGDLAARGRMQLGAAYAGTAIENSMLGAAHAAANPLSAHYGTTHGVAVGLMLPHVMRFNARDPEVCRAYAELEALLDPASGPAGLGVAADRLIRRIEGLLNLAGIAPSLAGLGVEPAAIPSLAAEAARQWTAQFNPRPVTAADFVALYEAAWVPRDERVGQD